MCHRPVQVKKSCTTQLCVAGDYHGARARGRGLGPASCRGDRTAEESEAERGARLQSGRGRPFRKGLSAPPPRLLPSRLLQLPAPVTRSSRGSICSTARLANATSAAAARDSTCAAASGSFPASWSAFKACAIWFKLFPVPRASSARKRASSARLPGACRPGGPRVGGGPAHLDDVVTAHGSFPRPAVRKPARARGRPPRQGGKV